MGKKYLGAAVVASNDLLFIAQLNHHGYHSGLACDVVSVTQKMLFNFSWEFFKTRLF